MMNKILVSKDKIISDSKSVMIDRNNIIIIDNTILDTVSFVGKFMLILLLLLL